MKINNIADATQTFFSSCGIYVSVIDLTQVLNLILLIVSILNILIVFGIRLHEHIKNKDIEAINNDFKEVKEEVEKLKK